MSYHTASMLRACEKRTVPLARLEQLTDEIEQNLQNSLEREITTDMVGEQVMEKLRGVDEVAYVRFASVYRQFKDIHTFMAELTKLLEEKYTFKIEAFPGGIITCTGQEEGAFQGDFRVFWLEESASK